MSVKTTKTAAAARKASAPKASAAAAQIDLGSPAVGTALAALRAAAADYVAGVSLADEARSKSGNAQGAMIAALSQPGVLAYPLTFDVVNDKGDVVEHVKATVGAYLEPGFGKHSNGTDYTLLRQAYNAVLLSRVFGVPRDHAKAESLLSAFRGKAVFAAAALVKRGCVATLNNEGKLTYSAGEGGTQESVDLLSSKAKSAAKLSDLGREDLGMPKATGGAGASTASKDDQPATAQLSRKELVREVHRLARDIAAGKDTATEDTCGMLIDLSKIVAANPRMFGGR